MPPARIAQRRCSHADRKCPRSKVVNSALGWKLKVVLGGLALLQEIPEYLLQAGTTERIMPRSVMYLVECINRQAPAQIRIIEYGDFVIPNTQAQKMIQLLSNRRPLNSQIRLQPSTHHQARSEVLDAIVPLPAAK